MRIAVWTKVRMFSGLGVIAAATLASASVARAEGSTLYRWETADGTVSFTDDVKRVPERYRGAAETVDRSMLTDYGRYTATDGAAHAESSRRLAERLAAMRAANGADEDARAADAPERAASRATLTEAPVTRDIHRRRRFYRADGSSYYRYYTDQTTEATAGATLPVDPNDPNPVVTETRRVLVPGQPITQTVTVVRQGDRVLSVTKPRSHYHKLDFADLPEVDE